MVEDKNGIQIEAADGLSVVGFSFSEYVPEEVERANATLISAAPEMLVAIKRIEAGCSFPEDDVQKAIVQILRPLIVKAEGRGLFKLQVPIDS